MTFVMLGLVNVRRNLGRSVLAIVSMAVASLVVTSLLSLAPSAHTAEFLAQRFLFGGDIIVTGQRVMTSAADLDPASNPAGSWHLDRMPLDTASLLGEAVPWPWLYGCLRADGDGEPAGSDQPGAPGDGQPGATLSDGEIAALREEIAGDPKVAGVVPLSYMPVLERSPGGDAGTYVRGYLVGRDVARDAAWWGGEFGSLVDGGRYLAPEDGASGGRLVAVSDASRGQRGYPVLLPGGTAELLVPRVRTGDPLRFDYSDPIGVSIAIAGTYRTETAAELTDDGPIYSYWGSGALFVPQTTLDALARQAGLPRAPVAGLAIKAEDLVHIDQLAARIRQALPDAVVFSVRELERSLQWTGGTTPLTGELSGGQVRDSLVPRGLPLDLNLVFAVLAFTIAALIVAANLLVLLTERRREISILRSLGARTGDIAVMVLVEAIVISLAGCILGFWPIRLLATLTLVANRLSIGRIAALTFGDFGLVVGIALGLATVFGLLPAIASTRTTCMEALRND